MNDAELEIPDELIATIPDVDHGAPTAGEVPVRLEVLTSEAPEALWPSTFAATLAQMRKHFEQTMQAEISVVESSMSAAFADLSAAIQAREAEVQEARAQLERIRAEHEAAERKLAALKQALQDG